MDLKTLIDAEMAEYSNGAYADHGSARDSMEKLAVRVLSTYADRIFDVAAKLDAEFGRENGPGSEWLRALVDDMRSNAALTDDEGVRVESAGMQQEDK